MASCPQRRRKNSAGLTGRATHPHSAIPPTSGGRGRWLDNRFIEWLWRSYKYENVYLRAYESPAQLEAGTAKWFIHYNDRRPHQALGYRTPLESYLNEN